MAIKNYMSEWISVVDGRGADEDIKAVNRYYGV